MKTKRLNLIIDQDLFDQFKGRLSKYGDWNLTQVISNEMSKIVMASEEDLQTELVTLGKASMAWSLAQHEVKRNKVAGKAS